MRDVMPIDASQITAATPTSHRRGDILTYVPPRLPASRISTPSCIHHLSPNLHQSVEKSWQRHDAMAFEAMLRCARDRNVESPDDKYAMVMIASIGR